MDHVNPESIADESKLNNDEFGEASFQFHNDVVKDFPSIFQIPSCSCSTPKGNNVVASGNANTKEENTQSSVPSTCNHRSLRVDSKYSVESQIIYLLCELEAEKKANKNLKAQLKAVTAELNILKLSSHNNSSRYSPGMLTAMISEVYQAQHDRDDALMARIRLANDERDEALFRLDELNEKLNGLHLNCEKTRVEFTRVNIDEPEGDSIRSECLNEADYILNNQDVLLRQVERKKVKDRLNATNLSSSKSEDSSVETPPSSLKKSDNDFDLETRVRFLERRLLEEIRAKEDVQTSCRRLERLVGVLRKKVNGFSLQRGQGSSDESRDSPPLVVVTPKAAVAPASTSSSSSSSEKARDLP